MDHDPNIFRDSSQVIQEVEDQLERILQKKIPRRRFRSRRAHQPRKGSGPQAQGRDRARVRKGKIGPQRIPGHGPRLRGAAGRPAQRGPRPVPEGPQVPGRDREPGQVHGGRDQAGERDPGAARGPEDEDLRAGRFPQERPARALRHRRRGHGGGAQAAQPRSRRGAREAAQDQGAPGHRVGGRQPRPPGRQAVRRGRPGRDGRRRGQGRPGRSPGSRTSSPGRRPRTAGGPGRARRPAAVVPRRSAPRREPAARRGHHRGRAHRLSSNPIATPSPPTGAARSITSRRTRSPSPTRRSSWPPSTGRSRKGRGCPSSSA